MYIHDKYITTVKRSIGHNNIIILSDDHKLLEYEPYCFVFPDFFITINTLIQNIVV